MKGNRLIAVFLGAACCLSLACALPLSLTTSTAKTSFAHRATASTQPTSISTVPGPAPVSTSVPQVVQPSPPPTVPTTTLPPSPPSTPVPDTSPTTLPAPIAPVSEPSPPPTTPAPQPATTDATSTDTADWACIRNGESGDRYNDPSAPSGAYGILESTAESNGWIWPVSNADPGTQDGYALSLYTRYGWQPWSTAPGCGL